MLSWVRPSTLGTKADFKRHFETPVIEGLTADAPEAKV